MKRTIECPHYFYIFNFFGYRDVDCLIIEGKNQLYVIVINEYRLDESVNQTLLIFFKSQIEVAEFVESEDNKLLRYLRFLGFLNLDIPFD